MILLDFYCKQCERQFEEMVSNREDSPKCPNCGSAEVKRLLSAVKRSGSNFSPDDIGASCGPIGGFS
jgi:putative FmdB family regulatory protein